MKFTTVCIACAGVAAVSADFIPIANKIVGSMPKYSQFAKNNIVLPPEGALEGAEVDDVAPETLDDTAGDALPPAPPKNHIILPSDGALDGVVFDDAAAETFDGSLEDATLAPATAAATPAWTRARPTWSRHIGIGRHRGTDIPNPGEGTGRGAIGIGPRGDKPTPTTTADDADPSETYNWDFIKGDVNAVTKIPQYGEHVRYWQSIEKNGDPKHPDPFTVPWSEPNEPGTKHVGTFVTVTVVHTATRSKMKYVVDTETVRTVYP